MVADPSRRQLAVVQALPARRSPQPTLPKSSRRATILGSDRLGAIWTLVRTDFKVRYHGTAMGFLWALLKPLAIAVVLISVFSFIFRTDQHYALNLLLGLFIYDFFSEATKTGVTALAAKGYLIAKCSFPRWIFVVTSGANALLNIAVTSTALIVHLWYGGQLLGASHVGLYVFYIASLQTIVVGFSLAASLLFLRYRDLNQIWEVALQAGFFAAPVIYPLGILPERVHFWLYLWPPTAVIEFSRTVLVRGGIPSLRANLLLAAMAAATLAVGLVLYRRLAPSAAEHV